MTRYQNSAFDIIARIVFTVCAVAVLGLVLSVVFSCSPTRPVPAVHEGIRAELGAGCYGATPWCFCPYHCGEDWHLDATHRVWRKSVAECNCTT